ncbi:MAG: hypothetical protein QOH31_1283 [Verrucomicrobiota bacterium]|jgi:hypothetical protein
MNTYVRQQNSAHVNGRDSKLDGRISDRFNLGSGVMSESPERDPKEVGRSVFRRHHEREKEPLADADALKVILVKRP